MKKAITQTLWRDTGLKIKMGRLEIGLEPNWKKPGVGGSIVFRCKNRTKRISIRDLFMNMVSSKPKREGLIDSDWVDLGSLESIIMVQGEEELPMNSKAKLYKIIRQMRDNRRNMLGLPPVTWGGAQKSWDNIPSLGKIKKVGKILRIAKRKRIKLKRVTNA